MSQQRPYYGLSRTLYEREPLVPRDETPPSRNNYDHLYHRKEVIDAYMEAQNDRMTNIEGRLTAAESTNTTQDATLSNHETRIQALEQDGGGASFPIYQVKQYGAVGDGTVPDEGSAIQAAIDAAWNAGGGTVFIPEGIYNLQTTLYIRSGVRILMARGAVLRRNSSGLPVMICPMGDHVGYQGVGNWGIEGGVMDATNSYGTACLPIGMSHGEGVVIRDLHIRSVLGMPAIWINAMKRVRIQSVTCTGYVTDDDISEFYAIFLSAAISDSTNVGFYPFSGSRDGTPCEDIVVEGCHIDGWRGGVGGESCVAGIYHRNIRIVNNLVQNASFCGIKVGSFQGLTISGNELHQVGMGIEVNSGGVAGEENNSSSAAIVGNIVRETTDVTYGYGIWLNEKGGKFVENSVVSNNVIDGAVGTGIYVQGSPSNNIINNHVTNSGGRGIYINGSSNCSVQGNMIRNSGHMGLSLNGSHYCAVTGNYITRSAGYAIDMSGSTHCLVSSNMTNDNRLNSGIAAADAEIAAYSNADQCAFLNNVTRSPINTRGIDMTSSIDNAYCNGNDCRYGTGTKATIVGGTGTDKTSANYAG